MEYLSSLEAAFETQSRKPQHSRTNSCSGSTDRFVPCRSDFEMKGAQYNMLNTPRHKASSTVDSENVSNVNSPSTENKARVESYRRNLDQQMLPESKILHFSTPAPAPKAGHLNSLKVLYTTNHTPQLALGMKNARRIPKEPERTLDLPTLNQDYYLNLLDWSAKDTIVVGLGREVYTWNASSGDTSKLMESTENITSVNWCGDGQYLAVGLANGDVQVWDATAQKKLRSMRGHTGRVGVLSWNAAIVSSGSADTSIVNHDVRIAQHQVMTLNGHGDEICGLKWNAEGTQMASGSNDNLVQIWDAGKEAPRCTLDAHMAATRALAWCPWQRGLLATGGGLSDRSIKFWNTHSGALLNSIDTGSQVTALLWSKTDRELVSAHGYNTNELAVWKYPSLVRVASLPGHSSRVLHLAANPSGTTIASAGADEKLCFWPVFSLPEKKQKAKFGERTASLNRMNIR